MQVNLEIALEPLKPFSSLLGLGSTQLALDLSLLALESRSLALGIFARRVALFLTQVDSNPMQVE